MVDMPNNITQGAPPPAKSGKKGVSPVQAAPVEEASIEIEAADDEIEETEDELEAKLEAIRARKAKIIPKLVLPGHKEATTLRILLEDNTDIPPTGQYIGHNGNGYLLKTGVWVDVPLQIIEILNAAVEMKPELNGAKQVIGWREKLRYPYRVAPGQHQAA